MPISKYNEDGTVNIYGTKTGRTWENVKPEDLGAIHPGLVGVYQEGMLPQNILSRKQAETDLAALENPELEIKEDPLAAQKTVALEATNVLEERYGRGDTANIGTSKDLGQPKGPGIFKRAAGLRKSTLAPIFRPKLQEDFNIFRNDLAMFIPVFTQAFGSGAPQEPEAKRLIENAPGKNTTDKEAVAWFEDVKRLLGEGPDNLGSTDTALNEKKNEQLGSPEQALNQTPLIPENPEISENRNFIEKTIVDRPLVNAREDNYIRVQKELQKEEPDYEAVGEYKTKILELDALLAGNNNLAEKYKEMGSYKWDRDISNFKAFVGNSVADGADFMAAYSETRANDPANDLRPDGDLQAEGWQQTAEWFRENSGEIRTWAEVTAPQNMKIDDKIKTAISSLGTFLVLGKVSGGGMLPSLAEIVQEAGPVYEYNRAQGETPEKSSAEMLKNMSINAPAIILLNKYGLYSDADKTIVKSLVDNVISEMGQEEIERMNGEWTRQLEVNPPIISPESRETMFITAITALFGTGINVGMDYNIRRQTSYESNQDIVPEAVPEGLGTPEQSMQGEVSQEIKEEDNVENQKAFGSTVKTKNQLKEDVIKYAEEFDMELPLSATTSNVIVHQMEAVLSHGMFGEKINNQIRESYTVLDKKSVEILNDIEKPDIRAVSEEVQKGLTEYSNEFNKNKTELYNKVDNSVLDSPAVADNTAAALDEIIERKESSLLSSDSEVAMYKEMRDGLKEGVTIKQLKNTRTDIGQKLKGNDPVVTGNKANYNRLYATLSSDMDSSIKVIDPKTFEYLDVANNYYSDNINKMNSAIGKKLLKATPDSITKLIQPDKPTDVALMKELIGEDGWKQVQAQFLAEIVENSVKKDGTIDPYKLDKQIERYGPEVIEEVFGTKQANQLEVIRSELNKIQVVKDSLNKGTKPSVGSQTAFLGRMSIGFFNPGLFIKSVLVEGGATVLMTSDAGRSFITKYLSKPRKSKNNSTDENINLPSEPPVLEGI